ncbi:ribonuclease HII [Wenxinia marina]|uniref:ribonuclease HII n=1 Tax=Wenxinia marina TaxID=390641 RepID=UPI00037550B3|nr:ribonuclease HII [Wenxinia marina]GGL81833.1 ribonuclease HII [Wenxinia marina]
MPPRDTPEPIVPDYAFEAAALARGARRVAGVDEAGRGPLAGPVVAAAVVLEVGAIPEGLADSKTLPAARREALYDLILARAEVGVGVATVEEIDEINILRASHVAMVRALRALPSLPCHALIDGNMIPRDMVCAAEAVVKGDGRCLSVAAASIVAKTWRDRIMVDLAQQHPGYGWETNVGYGTECHREALQRLGPTPHHRRSFKPVHNILYQAEIVTS